MDVKYWGGSAPPQSEYWGGGLEPPQPPSSYAPVMGGFRGVLGFLETPWGSPRFFPSFYSLQKLMIVATCLPNVAFQQACQWMQASRSSPDPALLNSSAAVRCRATRKAKTYPGNGTKACFWCPTIHFSFMQHVCHSTKS